MTVINRLIKEAKRGAGELQLPENHIGSMAQHICDTTHLTRDKAEDLLRRGEIHLCGVPVRVTERRKG